MSCLKPAYCLKKPTPFTGVWKNPGTGKSCINPDHLGSSSHITDISGEVYQHTEYLPFGETFVEERNTEQDRFTYLYNGKELDEMTGLYFYGARYMSPRESIWLGCDPLMEKYPNFSPFSYCANNPLNIIDPSGRDIIYLNGEGNISKVVNDGSTRITIVESGGKIRYMSSYKINGSLFDWNNRERQIVSNIIGYYAKQANIGNVGATYESKEALAFYDSENKGIWVNPEMKYNGYISPLFNDINNLISIMKHEEFHRNDDGDGVKTTYASHCGVYVNQMTDDSFKNTTYDFQVGAVGSLVTHLYNAISHSQGDEVESLVKEFNEKNGAGWKIGSEYKSGIGWEVTYKGKTGYMKYIDKLNSPSE